VERAVLDSEIAEYLRGLGADGVSIVKGDAGLEVDVVASGGARLEADVEVGADVGSGASGFSDGRDDGGCGHVEPSATSLRHG
jgi:hypothetical protein